MVLEKEARINITKLSPYLEKVILTFLSVLKLSIATLAFVTLSSAS